MATVKRADGQTNERHVLEMTLAAADTEGKFIGINNATDIHVGVKDVPSGRTVTFVGVGHNGEEYVLQDLDGNDIIFNDTSGYKPVRSNPYNIVARVDTADASNANMTITLEFLGVK